MHFWTTCLEIQDFQNITDLYGLIFQTNHICSNGKYQLTDSLCNVCKVIEDYEHVFFMSSKY